MSHPGSSWKWSASRQGMETARGHMNISLRQQEVTLPVARADSFTVEEQGSLRRDLSPWDWGEDREVSASVLPVSAA